MATLYELTQQQQRLYDKLADESVIDPETGEVNQELVDMLNTNTEALNDKIHDYAVVYKQLSADAKMLKDEMDSLRKRYDKLSKNADYVKESLSVNMQMVGKDSYTDSKCQITFRKSTSVEIENESLLTEEWTVTETVIRPDKKKISAALKLGEVINGARLIERQNIQIK